MERGAHRQRQIGRALRRHLSIQLEGDSGKLGAFAGLRGIVAMRPRPRRIELRQQRQPRLNRR